MTLTRSPYAFDRQLVTATREGRQVRYDPASPRLAHALADLSDLDLAIERHVLRLTRREKHLAGVGTPVMSGLDGRRA